MQSIQCWRRILRQSDNLKKNKKISKKQKLLNVYQILQSWISINALQLCQTHHRAVDQRDLVTSAFLCYKYSTSTILYDHRKMKIYGEQKAPTKSTTNDNYHQ